MIRSITFGPYAKQVIPHWEKCAAWKDTLKFNEGLTVICGPNGSGKSSLLRLISKLLFAHQGGRSVVTWWAKSEVKGVDWSSVKLDHDGQGIWCLDMEHQPGLVGGMAGFDDDFTDQGFLGVMRRKASSGQQNLDRIGDMLKEAMAGKHPGIDLQKFDIPEALRTFLAGNGPAGQPTFLMDEPDRNLDGINQVRFWNAMSRLGRTCQIIVATHNPVPLMFLPEARIIETESGYRDNVKKTLDVLLAREGKKDAPTPPPAPVTSPPPAPVATTPTKAAKPRRKRLSL